MKLALIEYRPVALVKVIVPYTVIARDTLRCLLGLPQPE